jgi:ABC-type nitrate/sulfonate/bicarbonate transport system substrate-binding protein
MRLTTVTRTQGNNEALKLGRVTPQTCELAFTEVPVLIDAFRRMVRGFEFDVCELALTTYVCARAHGKRFTALPIFLGRAFHHGAIFYKPSSGIRTPKDLQGTRVGINRGYTVTTCVWARAVLQDEYGVDLSRITWVLSGDEHVAEYVPPANVVPLEPGKTLAGALAAGELSALISLPTELSALISQEKLDDAAIQPLIPNARERGLEALRSRGHYPINHLIVVKDELLEAHPALAADLFDAFVRSKQDYLDRLKAGAIPKPTDVDHLHARVAEIIGDPLPYGIAPNRQVLQELIDHAMTQRIITNRVTIEELFAAGTHELVG